MDWESFETALAESFFANYKKEPMHTRPWPTIAHLQKETFSCMEEDYNCACRHSVQQ